MKNNKIKTMEEVREEFAAIQAAEQHKSFVKSIENKTFNELNLQQQSYLYKEHKKLYDKLREDKEQVINDLLTLDNLKAKERERKANAAAEKAAFEKALKDEQEQESNMSAADKSLQQMLDRAFAETLKKYNLD